jgi:hypothetical protein
MKTLVFAPRMGWVDLHLHYSKQVGVQLKQAAGFSS